MSMAVHRDVVWMKVFKQDCEEDVNAVIRNDWLKKKWELLNPSVLSSGQSEQQEQQEQQEQAL